MKSIVVTLDYLGHNNHMETSEVTIEDVPANYVDIVASVLKKEQKHKYIDDNDAVLACDIIDNAKKIAKKKLCISKYATCFWKVSVK